MVRIDSFALQVSLHCFNAGLAQQLSASWPVLQQKMQRNDAFLAWRDLNAR